ncbi:Plasma alpha-L-fucosidase precursor, putative [Pediculus humanus corporis]|uniref:Putative alpha-L-fucosidase n=1 Tax=Pediculus humanus subsp. corporis TaxID=121224 RepID=E0W0P0_PEDHC|nr:Plasma alpha-L-fucosidase precursor, putative [Pediculus humanus corporis]EEB19196.1 Plasma alpha-L-fucosidase precursor, putative [Pediculus humanus corporis]
MTEEKYEPNWKSLDSRPLPKWYDDAKIGIFIHWGVFSVPSYGGEWFWNSWKNRKVPAYVDFMKKNYPPNFTYQDFAKEFTAEFFDSQKWAELFQEAGARYVVLTSKHHEGFTLWPSKYSFSWNSQDVGPNRNLVKELSDAIRNFTDLKFGLYHSLYEWFNPLYLEDKDNNFTTNGFVRMKTMPELYELVNTFRPEIIWSDGEWEAPDVYWTSKEFLAWLYNDSPVRDTVVTNDRWGQGSLCKHGDFYTCQDRYNPGVLQTHKWENCLTIDSKSWGYRRNAPLSDYMTIEKLLQQLVQTISCGGNFLVNVGPTKEGIITPIYEERLLQIGTWLQINGEAIYYSRPWVVQNDSFSDNVWYTQKDENVYAMVIGWPNRGSVVLKSIKLGYNATAAMLGYGDGNLTMKQINDSVWIKFPEQNKVKSQWVYTIKLLNVYH